LVIVHFYAPQYPFCGRTLEIEGFGLHYLDEGAGDPVVMLHGNPTWSFYYRNLVRALRGEHRVIVPDHIGCGLSEKPDERRYPYTLGRRVDDLDGLLERIGVRENVTLVMHDWGGMIGMAWAHRRPERVRRLVVLNTAAFHMPSGKRLPWALWLCRDTPLGPLLVRGLNIFSLAAVRWCVSRRMPDDVRAGYLAPYNSWGNRVAVLRFVKDIPLRPGDPSYQLVSDVQEGLQRFRDLPMLICWGEKDFVFDRHFLDEWRRRFPSAEVHSFADAGHFVLEDATDQIVRLAREFLRQHSRA
jgi:cis-3-alkyl-4-acyloxetan-2-one decarboxylase